MKNIAIITIALITVFLSSCGEHKEGDGHDHGAETSNAEEHHDEHENPSTAILTDEQMKSIKIEFGGVLKKTAHCFVKSKWYFKST